MTQLNLWQWVRARLPFGAKPGVTGASTARRRRRKPAPQPTTHAVSVTPSARPAPPTTRPRTYPTKQALYDDMTRVMTARYAIKVRKWRTSMSGIAWELRYKDGTTKRLIESPRPRSPMSAAIFLHEIGHHAIGLGAYKPRCLEEYHAWMYSLAQMEEWGIDVTDRVRTRVHTSLKYAVGKAKRRGIRDVPTELRAFL